jgi:hypothetical protein
MSRPPPGPSLETNNPAAERKDTGKRSTGNWLVRMTLLAITIAEHSARPQRKRRVRVRKVEA